MHIQYIHASKFGNGAQVAAYFKQKLADSGVGVDVHHVRDVRPDEVSAADLYVFSSPGRCGRPIRAMRRFLKKVSLPAGTRYAILTTEVMPKPDKNTGQMPTEEEVRARHQRVRPMMNEVLEAKGLIGVAEEKIYVTGLKGPLEDGWELKVDAFADTLCGSVAVGGAAPGHSAAEAASGREAMKAA